MQNYDLVVIGSGPAGEKGAALVECSDILGGACVNTGTIPSKILRESALYFSGIRQRGLYGVDYSLREGLTVKNFMHRKDVVVATEREKLAKNLAAHGIDLIRGLASFEDPATISLKTTGGENLTLKADAILIATGSVPHRAPEIPFDDENIFDSDSILKMDSIPRSLAVVGGGVIGCEYASIFTALGSEVSLVDGRDRVLPFLDAEISACLRERLAEIPLLFRHFLVKYSEKFQKQPPEPSSHLLEAALKYGWPGNLRELNNFLKRYLILQDARNGSGAFCSRAPRRGGQACARTSGRGAQ